MMDEEQDQTISSARRKPLFGSGDEVVRQEQRMGKSAFIAVLCAAPLVSGLLYANGYWIDRDLVLVLLGLLHLGIVAFLAIQSWKVRSHLLNAWGAHMMSSMGKTIVCYAIFSVAKFSYLIIGISVIVATAD